MQEFAIVIKQLLRAVSGCVAGDLEGVGLLIMLRAK